MMLAFLRQHQRPAETLVHPYPLPALVSQVTEFSEFDIHHGLQHDAPHDHVSRSSNCPQ
jgi:hypothetical protein